MPTDETIIMRIQEDRNIVFYDKDGEEVGKFIFSESPVRFEGRAGQAADIFIDAVLQLWRQKHEHKTQV